MITRIKQYIQNLCTSLISFGSLMLLVLALGVSSCATDDSVGPFHKGTPELASVNISLSTGIVSSGDKSATRSSGALPTDMGGTVGTNEGTLNHICVGLFDTNNKLVTLHEYDYKGNENVPTRTDAVKMLVFANVPVGAFAGKNTVSDFYTVAQDLGYTSSADGKGISGVAIANSQSMKSLPMMSTVQNLNWSSGNTLSPTVSLTRLVARVALTSLIYGFSGPYQGCSFAPSEVFMYNANNQLTNWNTKTATGNVSGESNNATSTAYLGSGAISTFSCPYYFYVFPHSSTTPTKLVIKGTFKTKSGSTYTTYYPITVNNNITASGNISSTVTGGNSQISSNTTYGLDVTINGTGVNNVSDELTSANVTVNTSVADYTSPTVNEYFGLNIGDYLYADGSSSSTFISNRTPIAIVFSTKTSTADKALGFYHGYAMALQNAGSSAAVYQWYTANSGNPTGTALTTPDQIMGDKDGYTHTGTIQATGYAAGIAAKGYTAVDKSGKAVTVPSGTSGWYLPSVGQWYDICANLGGMVASSGKPYTTTMFSYISWYGGDDSSGKNYSSLCASAINVYLNALKTNGYNYVDLFSNSTEVYWSSSESSAAFAYSIYLHDNGAMVLNLDYKTYSYRVRPVIAF